VVVEAVVVVLAFVVEPAPEATVAPARAHAASAAAPADFFESVWVMNILSLVVVMQLTRHHANLRNP
jgi:hypothetical protein